MEEFPEEFLDPPGTTSGDFGLSEAAKVHTVHYHSNI